MSHGVEKVFISEVVVDGNQRTKLGFFQRLLRDQDISTAQAKQDNQTFTADPSTKKYPVWTIGHVGEKVQALQAHLQESQLFENVEVQVVPIEDPQMPPGVMKVLFAATRVFFYYYIHQVTRKFFFC